MTGPHSTFSVWEETKEHQRAAESDLALEKKIAKYNQHLVGRINQRLPLLWRQAATISPAPVSGLLIAFTAPERDRNKWDWR
jgi:hypothetical protein